MGYPSENDFVMVAGARGSSQGFIVLLLVFVFTKGEGIGYAGEQQSRWVGECVGFRGAVLWTYHHQSRWAEYLFCDG